MSASGHLKRALKNAIKPPVPPKPPVCQITPLSLECTKDITEEVAAQALTGLKTAANLAVSTAVDKASTAAEDALLSAAMTAGIAGGPVGLAGAAVCLISYAALKYKDEIWDWGKDVLGFGGSEEDARKSKLRRENRQAAADRAILVDMLRMALINRAEVYLKNAGLDPLLQRVGSREWVEGSDNNLAVSWMNNMKSAWGDGYSPAMTRDRIFSKTGDNPRLGGGFGRKGCFTVLNRRTNDAAWWLTSTHIICNADKNRYIFTARPQGQEYYAAIEAYLVKAMEGADTGVSFVDAIKTYDDPQLKRVCGKNANDETEQRCKIDALTWSLYLSYWDTKGGPTDHWKGVKALQSRYPRELDALVTQDRIKPWHVTKAALVTHTREGLKRPFQALLREELAKIRPHLYDYTEELNKEVNTIIHATKLSFVYRHLTGDTETYLVNGVENRKLTPASGRIWSGWAREIKRQSAAYKKAQKLPNRCVVPAPYVQAIDNEDWCKQVDIGLYQDPLTDLLRNHHEHLIEEAIRRDKLSRDTPRILSNADARASYALPLPRPKLPRPKLPGSSGSSDSSGPLAPPKLRKASVGFTAVATVLGTATLYYLLMHRRDR